MTWYGSAATAGSQQRDRLVVLAPLHQQLREVDARAEIAGVDRQHLPELRHRIVDAVLGLGDEAEDVVRLRRLRVGGGRGLRLLHRRRQIRHVEERDGEVDARERELGSSSSARRKLFAAASWLYCSR